MQKKVVYIAHPISGNVEANLKAVYGIISAIAIAEPDVVPIAPYTAYLQALNEEDPAQREQGLTYNLTLIASGMVHELRTYGPRLSRGMLEEVRHALEHGVPVVDASGNNLLIPMPELICNGCGWIGSVEDMRHGNECSRCPECEGTDVGGDVVELRPGIGGGLQMEERRPVTFKLEDKQNNVVRIIIESDPNNPSGANLVISGDMGDYSYYWGAMGKGGPVAFLASLNIDYMAGKMGQSRYLDLPATIEAMKQVIHDMKEEPEKTEEAIKEVDSIASEVEAAGIDVNTFCAVFWSKYHLLSDFFETPDIHYKVNPRFARFWSNFWVPFTTFLKKKYANRPI